MSTSAFFKVNEFINGYLAQLRNDCRYYSDNIDHSSEKGRLNETHLAAILRKYLSQRFGIGTGFVASANGTAGKSHQSDIIIYDTANNAPIYQSDAFAIYPIEMVYGVVEVKTNAKRRNKRGSELDDCFRKCAHLRSMAQMESDEAEITDVNLRERYGIRYNEKRQKYIRSLKGYIRFQATKLGTVERMEYYEELPPRFFIFSYRGWEDPRKFHDDFLAATEKWPAAHIHGFCCLTKKGSFYTRHVPYETSKDKVLPIVTDDGFREFLFSLPELFETMLPPYPHRAGAGFDLVNLQRYHVLSEAPLAEESARRPE